MPHYIYLGEMETLHQRLGLLTPGVSFEVGPDLVDEADAMVESGVMQHVRDEAPGTSPADEPELPDVETVDAQEDDAEDSEATEAQA